MYGSGVGFTPDAPVEGATLAVVAQAPGADEEAGRRVTGYSGRNAITEPVEQQPLIGKTGLEWETMYLPQSGFSRPDVSLHNILKCRVEDGRKRTNEWPAPSVAAAAVAHCTKAHLHLPASTKLIVAMGDHAWEFFQGPHYPITTWRGYVGPHGYNGVPVFGVQHTASLFREPKMKLAARSDWRRVGKWFKGEWPRPFPRPFSIVSDTDVPRAVEITRAALASDSFLYLDTEYLYDEAVIPGQHPLTMVGLGWASPSGAIEGWQCDVTGLGMTPAGITQLAALMAEVAVRGRVVIQNAAADLPVLEFNWGVSRWVYRELHDLLLGHAVLWPELPHDLEYIMSTEGAHEKTKHLDKLDPEKYNWGDVVELAVAFPRVLRALQADPALLAAYRRLCDLVPIHTQATTQGIAVNKAFLLPALQTYGGKIKEAIALARAYTGFAFNVGSSEQLGRVLYNELGLPVQRNKETKQPTVNDDAIAVLREKVGPAFDGEWEERNGVDVDYVMKRIEEGANPLLEARVLYANAQQVVSHYLSPLVRRT
jgi:uracil-DNA glycosylase family 4